MTQILWMGWVTVRQCANRNSCWLPFIFLLVGVFLSFFNSLRSLGDFYRSRAFMTSILFAPLLVCAGVVADEVASGRVLVLHGLGVSRLQFLAGRVAGTVVFCFISVLVPHILVCAYLAANGLPLTVADAVLTPVACLFYFAYLNALLTLFSTLMRSWGNSALVFGLQAATGVLFDLVGTQGGAVGKALFRFGRLVFLGPFGFVLQTSQSIRPEVQEVIFVVIMGSIWLSSAVLLYGRADLGVQVGRTG